MFKYSRDFNLSKPLNASHSVSLASIASSETATCFICTKLLNWFFKSFISSDLVSLSKFLFSCIDLASFWSLTCSSTIWVTKEAPLCVKLLFIITSCSFILSFNRSVFVVIKLAICLEDSLSTLDWDVTNLFSKSVISDLNFLTSDKLS